MLNSRKGFTLLQLSIIVGLICVGVVHFLPSLVLEETMVAWTVKHKTDIHPWKEDIQKLYKMGYRKKQIVQMEAFEIDEIANSVIWDDDGNIVRGRSIPSESIVKIDGKKEKNKK